MVAVASNKGGVGKTTIATNLAIYLRALHEDLPVLLVGLDDQAVIDRMFRLPGSPEPETNLKHAFAARSLAHVVRDGQYGIRYLPTPPDTAALKARAEDPRTLGQLLDASGTEGLVVIDTKSDLESLTRNALFAADLVIVPIADRTSFDEAEKLFALLERMRPGPVRGRVLFTLVDRRTRVDSRGDDLHDQLERLVDARGWPRFQTWISRSPRVEALISADEAPGSILHHARGTAVHAQLRALAEEVAKALGLAPPASADGALRPGPVQAGAAASRGLVGGLKDALLRGLRSPPSRG